MATLTIRHASEATQASKPKKEKASKANANSSLAELKIKQRAELKQGLTEAILISRGEMDGIPLSDLWNE